MTASLIVAAREFRAITATRGFWVMLLIIPLAIAASQLIGQLIRPPASIAYVIVNPENQYAPAIDRRIAHAHQRQVLGDLSAYVERWRLGSVAPAAIWAKGRRWFSEADVDAFVASGGEKEALRTLAPHLPHDAPTFASAPAPFVAAAVPAGVPVDKGAEAFGAAIAKSLQGEVATDAGKKPLALAVYVPPDLGAVGAPVRMWTNGRPNDALIDMIRSELTGALRYRALQSSGLSQGAFEQIEAINAPLVVIAPQQGHGREQILIRSLLPLALVYLLLITEVVTGTMLLQGVIEEKSNKLLESILACIRPDQLMYGKLIGLGAVGLTIVVFWVGCALAAAFAVQGFMADFLRPSLAALNEPWMIAALVFYFLAGFLVVSMLYLAIGAVSNSMQDAQAYLMPVILITMLPTVMLMVSVLQNADSLMAHVLSWIPLYTPFAMLARLGSGVSITEVLATGALLVAFIVLETVLLGRVFRANLLQTGQPKKLSAFLGSMLKAER